MTEQEIMSKLKAIMRRSSQIAVDWDAVAPATAIASLGFDSLSILDLVYDIQQELGVEFEAEQLARIKTVGDLIAFLQSKGA